MVSTVLALMLLLLAPGPTNTLLLRAGVLFGFKASWRLVSIECLAYLLQVSVWGVALHYLVEYSLWALTAVQLAAACYLLHVSFTLWQRHTSIADSSLDRFSSLHFFWLTVMNPKGLLIVSFIAPIGTFVSLSGYVGFMALLAMVVIPVGAAWIVLGSRFEGVQKAWLSPLKINRITSVAIGCFATIMMGRLAGAVIH